MNDVDSFGAYCSGGVFYAGLIFLLFPFIGHEIYANDLWKSLYFARYVSQFASFPHQSVFSFSPVVDLVPSDVYSWLGHLILYGIYSIGSIDALIGLRLTLVIGSLCLLHSLFDFRRSGAMFLLLLLWGIGLTQKTLVRTALFAVPLMTVFWWIWYQQLRAGSVDWFLWVALPVLFVGWGNIHASYLVGIGILGLMMIGRMVDRFQGNNRPCADVTVKAMAGLLFLCVAVVVFVKPYPDTKLLALSTSAVNLTVNTVERVGTSQEASLSIREQMYHGAASEDSMMRLGGRSFSLNFLHSPYVAVSLFLFLACCFTFVVVPGPIRWTWLLPVLTTGVLAALFLRFVAYVPLVVVPATYLNYLSADESIDLSPRVPVSTVSWVVAVLFVVPWFYVINGSMDAVMHNPDFRAGWGTSPKFSHDMAEYVNDHHGESRMFNHYDIGGFLIWTWWPDKKVFIDSRDKAYQPAFRDTYFRDSPVTLMKRHDLNWALFPLGSAWNYYVFIPDPAWQLVKFDDGMALYVRADSEDATGTNTTARNRLLEGTNVTKRVKRFRRFVKNHENRSEHVGVFQSIMEN